MKKVYQVGHCAPVSTYKAALRQHAKFKMSRYIPVWKQPIGCNVKYGVNQWVFKPLTKHGKLMGWSGLRYSTKL